MCWTSKNLKIKTAKRNIPIWKVVHFDKQNKIYVSPIKGYHYIPDKHNIARMTFQTNNYNNEINGFEGFHSFSNKVCYKYYENSIHIYKKCIFAKRFIYSIMDGGYNFSPAIAKGYLPKGTKYAINKVGEVISDCIVINEFIDL